MIPQVPTNDLFSNLIGVNAIHVVIKISVIVVLFFYSIYEFMVTRQIRLLNKTLKTDAATLFSTIGLLLFFSSIALLFITLLTLL